MRSLLLPAAVLAALAAAPASAQIDVDNRGLKVDPAKPGSPEYGRSIEDRNRAERERAEREGGSHLDTTYGQGETVPEEGAPPQGLSLPALPGQEAPAAAPRPSPRPAAERPTAPSAAASGPAERPRGGSYEALDEVNGGGLRDLIGELLKALDRPPRTVRLRALSPAAPAPASGETAGAAPAAGDGGGSAFPAVKAGEALYARVLYAVDSDFPGPVLLEILEPPLAGAVATGTFDRVRDRLVVRVSRLSWRGVEAPAEGWAVGLDCACFGIEGEVDRHWFERLILPAAFRFAEGFFAAKAAVSRRVEVSGETVIEEQAGPTDRQAVYAGIGNAARSAGEILLEDAPTGPTVRIPRDAELAVVFARPPGAGAERGRAPAPASRGPLPPASPAGIVRARAAAASASSRPRGENGR
ncbi:MAG: DotG/IcmE/VirB10 family protein [Defluviicoccus sp.]|nr:DotG/IcmE/VirB10 family protein [Defluviicoccus sp.]